MSRLREADRPQTAFLEARGDLCSWLVLQRKSGSPDPTKLELQITPDGNWRSKLPHQPFNRPLHSGDQSQKTIQYP